MSTKGRDRQRHARGKTQLLADAPQEQSATGEARRRAVQFRRQTAMRAPIAEVPVAETETPPGSLTPEAAAQLSEARQGAKGPSFTPHPPDMTGPQPALGRPYLGAAEPPEPLEAVFEAVAAVMPLPEPMTAEEAARLADAPLPSQAADAPGAEVMLYSGEGWTQALSSYRIRTGEWDDWPADIERGFGRNAAESATSFRHARQGIATAWRQTCIGSGHPDWIDPGLRRIHEFVIADREAQERRATDTEAFRVLGREVTR